MARARWASSAARTSRPGRAGEVDASSFRSSSATRRRGVISLQNLDREHAFSEADVRLLTTLAGSLSVALENARLFDETQRCCETNSAPPSWRSSTASSRASPTKLDMQAMYDLVGDKIQEIFDAQVVDIGVFDRDRGLIHFPYADRARRALPGRADRAS